MGKPLFALQDEAQDSSLLVAINTAPLVDVMLVLLIIFLITIPVFTSAVKLVLPQDRPAIQHRRPQSILISVDRQGQVFLFDNRVPTTEALAIRLRAVAAGAHEPEVHIRGDRQARFEGVRQVLLACQLAGIAKVSFVTEAAPQP